MFMYFANQTVNLEPKIANTSLLSLIESLLVSRASSRRQLPCPGSVWHLSLDLVVLSRH